jgi:sigma-B regulation protein RsbU (phosphoserine phosphatase)
MDAADSKRRPHQSIRSKLLLTVNLVLGLGLGLLLTLDYRSELNQRINEKQTAIHEEAITLLPSVLALRAQGSDVIQAHVDLVCGQMREATSPGHHIAVRLGETVLQAQAHHRASPELFAAMEGTSAEPTRRIETAVGPIVVGSAAQDDVVVYVAESVRDIMERAHGSLIRRTLGLAALCVLGAVVVNVILVRLVTRPLGDLVRTVRQIGAGEVGAQAGRFKTAELAFLSGEINAMSTSLANAENERARQFRKARRIQEHLCPMNIEVPGLRLAHVYEPATEITGDYFDLLRQSDGTWLLCVADVCGHGIPAAMEVAVLKTLLLYASEAAGEPGEILAVVNERFRLVTLPEDFATMVLVRWDPRRSQIDYASAGHETCFFLTNGGATAYLDSTGPVLGVNPDGTWTSHKMAVSGGDRLILLTDGIAETVDPQGKWFGRKRVRRYFFDHHADAPDELTGSLSRALSRFRGGRAPRDDITVLAAGFTAQRRPVSSRHDPGRSQARQRRARAAVPVSWAQQRTR